MIVQFPHSNERTITEINTVVNAVIVSVNTAVVVVVVVNTGVSVAIQ